MTSASLESILRSPTLVEKVCERLAVLSRTERGEEGGKLPAERALATQLGVSRNVVREATKRLELQGLLEIRQGQGTRVVDRLHKPISTSLELLVPREKERMRQLFEVRLMIEPYNARLAAQHATRPQMRRIEAAHARLVEAREVGVSVAADLDFHREIASASGNQIARLVLESLAELRAASHAKGFRGRTSAGTVEEHAEVLTAIRAGDGGAAMRAMKKHLLQASANLGLSLTDFSD